MSSLRFSRGTVLAAIELLERLSHADFTRFLYELGPDFPQWVESEAVSLKKRLNSFMGIYDQDPNRPIDGWETIQEAIVQKAVSLVRDYKPSRWSPVPPWLSSQQEFCRRLEVDGFVVSDGKLSASLPESVGLPTMQDQLRALLGKHNLQTALGHLDQALDAHARAHWAAANSQIRAFFDGLLDEICERIEPKAKSLSSGQPRRAQLAEQGFLSRDLNEWNDNGLGFINGLAKRLHPQGAHPGLSNHDDSTFRLHVVLLTARLLLVRYDAQRTMR
jgi:hypothetical protein